jgi:hypothetical protein
MKPKNIDKYMTTDEAILTLRIYERINGRLIDSLTFAATLLRESGAPVYFETVKEAYENFRSDDNIRLVSFETVQA